MSHINMIKKKEVKTEREEMPKVCPECSSKAVGVDPERGELACHDCGAVISIHCIDPLHEGSRGNSKEGQSQHFQMGDFNNGLLPDLGLSTVIDQKNVSIRMRHLINIDSRMEWRVKHMLIATTEIKRIGSLLNLPIYAKEYAVKIYRKAMKMKLLRGRSIKAMVPAVIFFVCRFSQIARTLNEIFAISDCDEAEMRECYTTLINRLNLKPKNLHPSQLVARFVDDLGLDAHVEKIAKCLISKYLARYPTACKDPKGIIAAAIYIAALLCHLHISQTKIASTIGLSETTLRGRFREMARLVKSRLP